MIQLRPRGSGARHAPAALHGQNEAWYTAALRRGSSQKMNTAKFAVISKTLTTGNRRAGMPSDSVSSSRAPSAKRGGRTACDVAVLPAGRPAQGLA